MQPTLYNNSLWGKDWTEALCDLPFQSANASSLKRCSFITEGMLSLPAYRARTTFPWCLQRDSPSSSALMGAAGGPQLVWGETGWRTGFAGCVLFFLLPTLQAQGCNFLCSQIFAHPLAASSGCAAERVKWPVQGSRAHLSAWVSLLHPWVQRTLCCCKKTEIPPFSLGNSKLMQESGKISWSW